METGRKSDAALSSYVSNRLVRRTRNWWTLSVLTLHPVNENNGEFTSSLSTRRPTKKRSPVLARIVRLLAAVFMFSQAFACIDNTGNLSEFPCLAYYSNSSSYEVTCPFDWPVDYEHLCITLLKNERFEGNGYEIDIYGFENWHGLFRIAPTDEGGPSSLAEAPLIHDVHMVGGTTSEVGGFIVQSGQKHFIVDSCSSSGTIRGRNSEGGGGICGHGCSGDILISNCSSSGEIAGRDSGGITGSELGINGDGTVNITHCHSIGDIVGQNAGGICGWSTSKNNDKGVFITHSYSTGNIVGPNSGGICGWGAGCDSGYVSITFSYSTGSIAETQAGGICGMSAANNGGNVAIDQCYSVGEISGDDSGGITGAWTPNSGGYVSITNSYSRGDIIGSTAGGICGADTLDTVVLTNVYSAGRIQSNAGGIIGSVNVLDEVSVTMSVYSGGGSEPMVGDLTPIRSERNSNDLDDIKGRIYCYGQNKTACWDDQTIWKAMQNDFPVLLGMPPPRFTPTATPSNSPTHSPTPSNSVTKTSTGTSFLSTTPTSTMFCSPTQSPSATPTQREKLKQMELPVQYPRRSVV